MNRDKPAWLKRALRRKCLYCGARPHQPCVRKPRRKDALIPVNNTVVHIPRGIQPASEPVDYVHRSRMR